MFFLSGQERNFGKLVSWEGILRAGVGAYVGFFFLRIDM